MEASTWRGVLRFYTGLIHELNHAGVNTAAMGGIAGVYYGLVHQTKDCDLVVEVGTVDRVREVLEQMEQRQGVRLSYQTPMTAPLAEDWLAGGWSSHLRVDGLKEGGEGRLDFFSQPPRVAAWGRDEYPEAVDRDSLAWTKRTEREGKDWDACTLLGVRMIKSGDERGWQHLFHFETLVEMLREARPSINQVERRPLLGLVEVNPVVAEQVMEAERRYWKLLDKERLRCYRDALKPYGAEIMVRWREGLQEATFREQHAEMVQVARRKLPTVVLTDGIAKFMQMKVKTELGKWFSESVLHLADLRASERMGRRL